MNVLGYNSVSERVEYIKNTVHPIDFSIPQLYTSTKDIIDEDIEELYSKLQWMLEGDIVLKKGHNTVNEKLKWEYWRNRKTWNYNNGGDMLIKFYEQDYGETFYQEIIE